MLLIVAYLIQIRSLEYAFVVTLHAVFIVIKNTSLYVVSIPSLEENGVFNNKFHDFEN